MKQSRMEQQDNRSEEDKRIFQYYKIKGYSGS